MTLSSLFAVACAEGQAPERAVLAADEGSPRLRACLEGAGYDYDEVYPPWSSHDPPPEDSVFADPAFWQDFEGCLHDAGLSKRFGAARVASENRKTLEYVACMREAGWALPDPEPWEGPQHRGLLTPVDAAPPEHDPEGRERYFRDSADCGLPYLDEHDNPVTEDG